MKLLKLLALACVVILALVLVAGTFGGDGAEYRTEVNNLQRVISRGRQGSGPVSFDVQHPDGLTWRYGNDADSRVKAVGTALADAAVDFVAHGAIGPARLALARGTVRDSR